ncbi:MAG: signal peptidase I [Acidobacteriota bacterium]|nr:signal peptidase I [Acidobacteriota bacterium]
MTTQEVPVTAGTAPRPVETDSPSVESEKSPKKGGANRGFVRELMEVVFWAVPFFIFFSTFVFQNFKIPTQSMENSLLIGDHLTVNTYIYNPAPTALDKIFSPVRDPQRGDVVVFKYPGNPDQRWVKRLVGLPGEKLQIISDRIHIDGKQLDEQYAFYKSTASFESSDRDPKNRYLPMDYETLKPGLRDAAQLRGDFVNMRQLISLTRGTLMRYQQINPESHDRLMQRLKRSDGETIPDGFYFVMGDNRNHSADSRAWGLVPRELMEGRAYWVWWSYGEDLNTHLDRGVDFALNYIRYPFTFWSRTHWEQCFTRIR